jgi:hypothetical protein
MFKQLSNLKDDFTFIDAFKELKEDPIGKYLLKLNLPNKKINEIYEKMILKQNTIMKEIINEIFESYEKIKITNLFIKLFEKEIREIYLDKKYIFEKFDIEIDDSFLNTYINDEDLTELDYEDIIEEFDEECLSKSTSPNVSSKNLKLSPNSSYNSLSKNSFLSIFQKKNLKNDLNSSFGETNNGKENKINYKSMTNEELYKIQIYVHDQNVLFQRICGEKLFDTIYNLENNNLFLSFFKNDLHKLYLEKLDIFENELFKINLKEGSFLINNSSNDKKIDLNEKIEDFTLVEDDSQSMEDNILDQE